MYSGVEPLGSEWSSEALLWFQTLVDGEQLSACVRSVTKQGYGVELESRGQNVAAALISEQLAKVPGEISKETHAITASGAAQQESVKENEHSQIQVQASNQTGSSNEMSTEELTVAAPSGQLHCQRPAMHWSLEEPDLKWCVILFQLHCFLWTGRQWSCLSTRPSNLTLQLSLVLPCSTCSVPARVRALTHSCLS